MEDSIGAAGEWIYVRKLNLLRTTASGIVLNNIMVQRCVRADVLSVGKDALEHKPELKGKKTVIIPEFCGVVDDESAGTMFVRHFEILGFLEVDDEQRA